MSNTFTAQDMEDYADYVIKARRMLIKPKLSLWYAEKNKPTKKVIDLSVLIDSQIDCEFSNTPDFKELYISKLIKTDWRTTIDYNSCHNNMYRGTSYCRPRMNHKHAWQGGDCPLPEGFRVKVWFRGDNDIVSPAIAVTQLNWSHKGYKSDIIAFEVLEKLADGYVMPWEQDNG